MRTTLKAPNHQQIILLSPTIYWLKDDAAHSILETCATDLPMEKHAVAIQHQIPLKVIQEKEPIRFELNGALHGFGSSVLVSN